MKELQQRHRRYEDAVYVLEPDVKEGQGGIRDFQIGRWVIRAKYKTDRWDSILFPDHSQALDKSIQFLWAVRDQLHLLSGRKKDDFTFELQEKIAPTLGFSHGPGGIEEMMQQYHISTQRILNFVISILERAISEPSLLKKFFFSFKNRKIDQHFGLRNGELTLLDPVAFKREPSQLMILFKHCQTYRTKMDFRTEEAVLEALPFIDDRLRRSEEVNRTFLSILSKGESLRTILKEMHELGFLSKYVPEFSEIEGKIHYDLYHVHPVDVHSILAVEELEKLRNGAYQKEYPLLTSLMKEIGNPEILFLTALLHDIGKGSEGDHSLVGAELAKGIAGRMGVFNEEKGLIHFLVSHHLLLIETAFRRDLHDEQTILNFADKVRNLNQLKMLYLLTFADIKAVGPEAWTSWKDSLLMELFLKTSHLFEKEENAEVSQKENGTIKRMMEYLHLQGIPEYAEHLPARYLSCYGWGEIAHHIEMARSLDKESLYVRWTLESARLAKVTVCTKDRYGLFAKITGSMFINRLNILEAQIHTWGNGVALDTFYVEDATQEVERRLHLFKRNFEEILNGKISSKDLLSLRKESNSIQPKVIPKVPAEAKIDNQGSDFYTIIEITGEDRLGILYEITQALTDHGCDIHFARISTLGNRIVDVFYVQDTWGEKLEGKDRNERLKQSLLTRLTST
jgi:[protein-PII] uridylyltransferase